MYPKQFELFETTMGVFLETKELSGRIDSGATGCPLRDKETATELLVKKPGGKSINEYTVNGLTVFDPTSIQQCCPAKIPCTPRLMDWKGKKHDDFSEEKKQKARCAVRLLADFACKIGLNTVRLLSRTVLSIQGEQTCRIYIAVPKNSEEKPLYVQFR